MKRAIVWTAFTFLTISLVGCGQEAGEHQGHATKPQEGQQGQEGGPALSGGEGMAAMPPEKVSDSLLETIKKKLGLAKGDDKRQGHAGHEGEPAAMPPEMPPDAVLLSPIRQQLAGVRTGVVEVRDLETTVRTVGIVDYDERKVARIHTKIEGWIEEIFVDFTGKFVKKGDPLFSVYSPELVATQEEYLLALKAKRYLEGSPVQEVSQSGHSLLDAAKRRLLLWDITEEQIQELEEKGKPKKSLTLYSPIDGIVVKKEAYKGIFVKPEMELYTIADLSTIWVYADIYEYELPLIKVGQEATVSLSYYPGQVFRGKVVYIYPYLKDKTRTIRVRFEFPNTPDWKLKPEMFSNVEVRIKLGKKLAVPEEAVLDSGTRQIVFVAKGDGMFEPREVKLGTKVEGYYEVLSGLSKGEKVVTSANFLIDSESRLKAAMGAMPGHK